MGGYKQIVKIANLLLLLLFLLAFGSTTILNLSITTIIGSPIQSISALCVVLAFIGTLWSMLPVPKFAFVKQMLMGTTLGCVLTWLWMWWTNSLADVCSGVNLGDFCSGQYMHWVVVFLYAASAILQAAFVFTCLDADGSAHGFSANSLSHTKGSEIHTGSTRSGNRGRGGVRAAWSASSDEERAERGALTGRSGRREGDGDSGSEWDSGTGGSGSSGEEEHEEQGSGRAYDPPPPSSSEQRRTGATSAYPTPHLSPAQAAAAAASHKGRCVPTGNIDPSADFSSDDKADTAAGESTTDFSGGSHVEGKPHAEGDSEMHTHMHLSHGSKEQEELEERIKLTLGGKDN
ncbi:hypothetical protein JCM6882_001412 [Rhodosporidiobolus microsporus]